MIETIKDYNKHYCQHTIIGVISEGLPTFVPKSLDSLVNYVATHILAQSLLFYLHHNLFIFGFVCGFIFDKEVLEVKQKVNALFQAQKTFLEKVLFFGGGGFLIILTKSTSIPIATFYTAAQMGADLYLDSKTRYAKLNTGEFESKLEE